MSEATQREAWSWEDYLDWETRQPVRYELIDGEVHATGGGTAEHDTIGNNLRAGLRDQLRGKPCRVQGPDLKVKAGKDGRYPDALIDCGARVPGALVAQDPRAVFEVLSRSTASIAQSLKLRDYGTTSGIRHYVLISRDEPRVLVYQRTSMTDLGSRPRGSWTTWTEPSCCRSSTSPSRSLRRPELRNLRLSEKLEPPRQRPGAALAGGPA